MDSAQQWPLQFTVLPNGGRLPSGARSSAYLLTDNWDDWFTYNTLYVLYVYDDAGRQHRLGGVKIGQFGMTEGQRRPDLPSTFSTLDDRFFSLGQDAEYYEILQSLPASMRQHILTGLHDLAFDLILFDRALLEDVTGVSLLGSVARTTVLGQFHRLSTGGVRLSRFDFGYEAPRASADHESSLRLTFKVRPESEPPTNTHVLIGRNGVGKTRLFDLMAQALVNPGASREEVGAFFSADATGSPGSLFANVVSVTFSAFDPFQPLQRPQNRAVGPDYAYIGLKRTRSLGESGPDGRGPKTPDDLAEEFGDSVRQCVSGPRAERWKRALAILESDPIFRDAEVAGLAELSEKEAVLESRGRFMRLSSGHKIVLLTVTRLVETVEERTLVLLDEPEAHLHPPLLSAFIRSLSDLLVNRNGVALIATHSPVVLQEVPRSCGWIMRRSGSYAVVERPEIETFGENVGILTRRVFGLEVSDSGFHTIIARAVAERLDLSEIASRFGHQLGGEALALAQALIATRDSKDS
ncbi:MAG TPA: AAA family ATPase [Egibacteraceae bacterium]|nr:AAA family ATPase [Egibacteraceae bacterium]